MTEDGFDRRQSCRTVSKYCRVTDLVLLLPLGADEPFTLSLSFYFSRRCDRFRMWGQRIRRRVSSFDRNRSFSQWCRHDNRQRIFAILTTFTLLTTLPFSSDCRWPRAIRIAVFHVRFKQVHFLRARISFLNRSPIRRDLSAVVSTLSMFWSSNRIYNVIKQAFHTYALQQTMVRDFYRNWSIFG